MSCGAGHVAHTIKKITFQLERSGQVIGLAWSVAARIASSVERLLENLGPGLDLFGRDTGQNRGTPLTRRLAEWWRTWQRLTDYDDPRYCSVDHSSCSAEATALLSL
jgi:hypothetical protein